MIRIASKLAKKQSGMPEVSDLKDLLISKLMKK